MTAQARPAVRIQVENFMAERAGLSFKGSGRWRLDKAINDALPDGGDRRCSRLAEGELENLWDVLTVQESYFHREPARLAVVRERVLAPARTRSSTLRIWSAGCARGEEPYTLAAMCLDEGLDGRYEVLGTDLSRRAIDAAREGRYSRWSLRGLEPSRVTDLFEAEGRQYRLLDRYREHVSFEHHNLLDPRPPSWGTFDLVVCRNVLIYFTPEGARKALRALVDSLVPGGWLILGAGDLLVDFLPDVQAMVTPAGLVYRKLTDDRPETPPSGLRRSACAPQRSHQAGSHRSPEQQGASAPTRPSATDGPAAPGVAALLAAAERSLQLTDASAAEQKARAVLELAPHEEAAHGLLVRSLAEQGRLEEALTTVQRALTELPEDADLRLLHAVVLLERGDALSAAAVARQAVYLVPDLAAAYPVLARAQELLGNDGGARRTRRTGRRLLEAGGR